MLSGFAILGMIFGKLIPETDLLYGREKMPSDIPLVSPLFVHICKINCAVYTKACALYNKLFNVQQFISLYVSRMLALVAVLKSSYIRAT